MQLQFGVRGTDLHHLYTDPGFRGRGVGRDPIEACKIKAALLSCRYLTVGTHPDTHRAQAFYQAQGCVQRDAHPPRFSIRIEA